MPVLRASTARRRVRQRPLRGSRRANQPPNTTKQPSVDSEPLSNAQATNAQATPMARDTISELKPKPHKPQSTRLKSARLKSASKSDKTGKKQPEKPLPSNQMASTRGASTGTTGTTETIRTVATEKSQASQRTTMPQSTIAAKSTRVSKMSLGKPSLTNLGESEGAAESVAHTPWHKGVEVIRAVAERLPETPGVYRMLDAQGKVLYVGKARRLRARVMSYTQAGRMVTRIRRMVALTRDMAIEHTSSNAEAMLLEMNLIKSMAPRFNIMMRDDKSYPFLRLDHSHPFPRLHIFRGKREGRKDTFGPFASSGAAYSTLETLQKAFMLRVCSDNVFSGRKRPCLLHQIKRCSAPCVGKISAEDYQSWVKRGVQFFQGRNHEIQRTFGEEMEQAAAEERFELAGELRDRIRALTSIQTHQRINLSGLPDTDVVVYRHVGGMVGIRVTFYRGGSHNGTRDSFSNLEADDSPQEACLNFLLGIYGRYPPPRQILTNLELTDEREDLGAALSALAGEKVVVLYPERGEKRAILDLALDNLAQAFGEQQFRAANHAQMLERLADHVGLKQPIRRIEVFDNSHLQGAQPVGALIAVDQNGFAKHKYRRFIIRGTHGQTRDDYASMREVLERRFRGNLANLASVTDPADPSDLLDFVGSAEEQHVTATSDHPDATLNDVTNHDVLLESTSLEASDATDTTDSQLPDFVILDGGPGQLSVGMEVFAQYGLDGKIALAALSKGPDRKAHEERLYLPGRQDPILFDRRDPLLLFLQAIRDEAHRFVIQFHRKKRSQAIVRNPIDSIPGIGAKRKRALMLYFGSAKMVIEAGVDDLAVVDGISRTMAERIYAHFHEERRTRP